MRPVRSYPITSLANGFTSFPIQTLNPTNVTTPFQQTLEETLCQPQHTMEIKTTKPCKYIHTQEPQNKPQRTYGESGRPTTPVSIKLVYHTKRIQLFYYYYTPWRGEAKTQQTPVQHLDHQGHHLLCSTAFFRVLKGLKTNVGRGYMLITWSECVNHVVTLII